MASQASIDKLSARDFPGNAVGCLQRCRGHVGAECQVGNFVRLVTSANAVKRLLISHELVPDWHKEHRQSKDCLVGMATITRCGLTVTSTII